MPQVIQGEQPEIAGAQGALPLLIGLRARAWNIDWHDRPYEGARRCQFPSKLWRLGAKASDGFDYNQSVLTLSNQREHRDDCAVALP
jgi:hypothetical protein